jgi:hypothetical protein
MNIVSLNAKILSRFDKDDEEDALTLASICNLLENKSVFTDTAVARLLETKEELEKRKTGKNTFIAKTNNIIQSYFEILQTPLSFNDREMFDLEKVKLQQQYLTLAEEIVAARRWSDIKIVQKPVVQIAECEYCRNNDPAKFEIDDSNKKYCLECSAQQETLETGITHKDYDRTNVVNKFAYSRIIHFQECIKQYQGKQNCKIPKEVFEKLEKKFKGFNLLNDSENNHIKYSRITKEHILMFLKQLGYANHYENANYIYYILLGKRIDDIDYLEDQLIEDFKELSSLYDSVYGKDKPKELKRKNFMNVQYILFQLLKNRNHDCNLEDFSVLKTIEKKKFHDEICSHLFDRLGWNFTPTF